MNLSLCSHSRNGLTVPAFFRRSFVAFALLLTVCVVQKAHAAATVIDLGTLGGDYSYATAINNNGQVVGESVTANGDRHIFLYSNGSMTDLSNLMVPTNRAAEYFASAINNNGVVVGVNNQGYQRAFVYDTTQGKLTTLGTFGGLGSSATGINDSGQVVGGAYTFADVSHAFLYKDGNMADLGTLGALDSSATAINEKGQIVGYSNTNLHYAISRAFLYSDGVMTDLATVSGSNSLESEAFALNDNGQIVGRAVFSNSEYHAFLYNNRKMIDLGTLGSDYSSAASVNNAGVIVGDSTKAGSFKNIPFIRPLA